MPQVNDNPAQTFKPAPWQVFAKAAGISESDAYAAWQKAVSGANNPNDMNEVNAAFQANLQKAGLVAGPTSPGTAPTTSGSGGSISGGGSGLSAKDKARALANAQAGFEQMIRTWGIEMTPKLANMVERAAKGGWNSSAFMSAVRGTEEYHKQFPGIQWKKGMSEATYNSQFAAFQAKAQDAGYRLGRNGFAVALKKGIDSTEWTLRVGAIRQIKANEALFGEFRNELVARGMLKPNEKLDPKELYKLVTRRGSTQWTSIWNEASAATGLEAIGITVGKGEDISRHDLLSMLKVPVSQLNPGEVVKIDYAQLAATAAKALPASRLYGMGVTKKDLVEMALGGKNAAKTAERVNLAIGTAEATATEQRAVPQLNQGGMAMGTPTSQKVQATE